MWVSPPGRTREAETRRKESDPESADSRTSPGSKTGLPGSERKASVCVASQVPYRALPVSAGR